MTLSIFFFFFFLLILGIWPMLLFGAAFMAVITWLARAEMRPLTFMVTLVLGLTGLLGGVANFNLYRQEKKLQAPHGHLHVKLTVETLIDGILFPAGTEVTRLYGSEANLDEATTPQPINVLGLSTRFISRNQDGWNVRTEREQDIDGWPCAQGMVRINYEGGLKFCQLRLPVEWKGWAFPKGVVIRPHSSGLGIDFSLVMVAGSERAVFAPEIGRCIASLGFISLNEDGSFDSVMLSRDEAFIVRDVPLHGTVRWRYDAVTLGVGRARPPVGVEGETRVALDGGKDIEYERVVVSLPDGPVTRMNGVSLSK